MILTNDNDDGRSVAVRYYLDRPGMDMKKSSVRLWRDPPVKCAPADIEAFLVSQGILAEGSEMIVEVWLEQYEAFMALDAADAAGARFDLDTSRDAIVSLRLTDVRAGGSSDDRGAPRGNCNTSPLGLFAFSLTMALEAVDVTEGLVGTRIEPSFVTTWGPYAFFVSGLLQLIVGLFEVTRNNVYGATAFSAFGCFWLANATKTIFTTYFPGEISDEFLERDDWGTCIRKLYILAFVCVLFKQTLVLNKLSTALISLLVLQLTAAAFAPFRTAMEWAEMVLGWVVSAFAFYVFAAEFTNEVYQREVVPVYPWSSTSPEEVFSAAGRENKLVPQAAVALRAARAPTLLRLRSSKAKAGGKGL